MIRVARLGISPVKSLGLQHPREIRLETFGVARDRRFVLLTKGRQLLNSRRYSSIMAIGSDCDDEGTRLTLRFPDGRILEGGVEVDDEPWRFDLWGETVRAHRVLGPWSEALSEFAGTDIVLVRPDEPGEGTDGSAVSLVSLASVTELSRRAGRETPVDAGRFRMMLEIDGCAAHEEDSWLGRGVRVGEATVRVTELDPRCAITTLDPATGASDFPTLKTIAGYRGVTNGELCFGVYATVDSPGTIRVGDEVEPLDV